jgi:hypothetical protein
MGLQKPLYRKKIRMAKCWMAVPKYSAFQHICYIIAAFILQTNICCNNKLQWGLGSKSKQPAEQPTLKKGKAYISQN